MPQAVEGDGALGRGRAIVTMSTREEALAAVEALADRPTIYDLESPLSVRLARLGPLASDAASYQVTNDDSCLFALFPRRPASRLRASTSAPFAKQCNMRTIAAAGRQTCRQAGGGRAHGCFAPANFVAACLAHHLQAAAIRQMAGRIANTTNLCYGLSCCLPAASGCMRSWLCAHNACLQTLVHLICSSSHGGASC